jgi:hypothetical protein
LLTPPRQQPAQPLSRTPSITSQGLAPRPVFSRQNSLNEGLMSWADEVRILGSKSPYPNSHLDRSRAAQPSLSDRSPSVKLIRDISLSQKKSQSSKAAASQVAEARASKSSAPKPRPMSSTSQTAPLRI